MSPAVKISQQTRVLCFFRAGRALTQIDANNLHPPIMRLADIAWKLGEKGHPVQSRWVTTSGGARIKEYGFNLIPSGELFSRPKKGRPE